MEAVRDLGDVDLWQHSIQRSLARRGGLPREARIRRRLMPVMGVGGSTVAVLIVSLPNLLGGPGASARAERLAYAGQRVRVVGPMADKPRAASTPVPRPRPRAALSGQRGSNVSRRIRVARSVTASTSPRAPVTTTVTTGHAASTDSVILTKPTAADAVRPVHAAGDIVPPAATAGPAATTSPVYVNPLAHASVTPERIDQGVDYGGGGDLGAIGAGQITYVAMSGTGWPGAFIEFRLTSGPDAGRYVFYAEGIVPAGGLHVGQRVRAGQKLATLAGSSSGIEIGWGAGIGTETYAMKAGQWKSGMDGDNVPTPAGRSFSALIASLGGPPGKVEG